MVLIDIYSNYKRAKYYKNTPFTQPNASFHSFERTPIEFNSDFSNKKT
jgi:hypothetical protein